MPRAGKTARCTVSFIVKREARARLPLISSARWRCAKTCKCALSFVGKRTDGFANYRAYAGWDPAAFLSGQGARAGRGADDEQVSMQQRRRRACRPVLPQAKVRKLQRRSRRQPRLHLVRHAGGGTCSPHTWRCDAAVFACCTAFDSCRACAALPNNPGNPAMFDWGTYVNGGRPDPTWCAPHTPGVNLYANQASQFRVGHASQE